MAFALGERVEAVADCRVGLLDSLGDELSHLKALAAATLRDVAGLRRRRFGNG
jgi:hypothetical protein